MFWSGICHPALSATIGTRRRSGPPEAEQRHVVELGMPGGMPSGRREDRLADRAGPGGGRGDHLLQPLLTETVAIRIHRIADPIGVEHHDIAGADRSDRLVGAALAGTQRRAGSLMTDHPDRPVGVADIGSMCPALTTVNSCRSPSTRASRNVMNRSSLPARTGDG